MKDNTIRAMLILAVWLAVYVPACALPQWRECRRVHPSWYYWMQEFK